MIIISVPGVGNDVVDNLKEEIKKSQEDPDHVIVTNYGIEVHMVNVEGHNLLTKIHNSPLNVKNSITKEDEA